MRILSVGEVLWDAFPEQERVGGAPLNFAINAVRLGDSAALVSAVGGDERGRRLREAIASAGVDGRFCRVLADQSTGVARVGRSPEGEPTFVFPRPAAFDFLDVTEDETREIRTTLQPDWLYFGTLVQTSKQVEETTRRLCEDLPGVRSFYDLNLRPGCWTLPLVERLSALATVIKLNEFEAETLATCSGLGARSFSLEHFGHQWSERFHLEALCITLGPDGCILFQDGQSQRVPGFPAAVQDTVGAGDAFAAAFLHGFHRCWPPLETARFANALGSIVAGRAGATPPWSLRECCTLAGVGLSGVHDVH